jgi:hypothetical protein
MELLICLIFSARAARGKNKNMIRPLARIFLRAGASSVLVMHICTIAAARWPVRVLRGLNLARRPGTAVRTARVSRRDIWPK